MIKPKLLFLFAFLLSGALIAQDNPLARTPSLSDDGSTIAFSYQGDIWTVPFSGGRASRTTIHEAYDSNPVWSPDGSYLAFTSERYGNNDIFTIPARGGKPVRLTYHSAGDAVSDWAGGGVYFTTARIYRQVEWENEIHSVSPEGSTPKRQLDALGFMPSVSPDGRFTAFVKGACRIQRQDYRGSANKDIWLYDNNNDKYTQLTNFDGNDYLPIWGGNSDIYFLSSRNGVYNVYKLSIDNEGNTSGSPEQVSDMSEAVRHFGVSADGSRLVLESGPSLYTMHGTRAPVKLDINVTEDYRFDPVEHKTFSKDIEEFVVSPNGDYAAFVIRGEVFISKNDKEDDRTVNISAHPYRDRGVQWLSDSTLLFVSDRDGDYDLYLARSTDDKETDLFKTLKRELVKVTDTDEDISAPKVSPDREKIAFIRGNADLVTANISSEGKLSDEKTLYQGWSQPDGVAWSPDSKWLAYSQEDLYFNAEVYIHDASNEKEPVSVSMHPKGDYNPVWSPDGSKLGFVSERNARNYDVWFVWLKESDWLKTKDEWKYAEDDEEKNGKKKDDKKDKDSAKVADVVIDFEGIHERLEQVTSLPGNEYSYQITEDGETFYFVANSYTGKKGNDLYKVKWDASDLEQVASNGANPTAIELGPKGKNLYMIKRGGSFARLELKNDKVENLPFNAKMSINHPAEMEQIFEEAWSELDLHFYDPGFNEKNWEALREKYKPWALKASTKDDFREIFNWMLGEVNASHMGLYGSDRAETQKEKTGLLGVELEEVSNGVKVTMVLPLSPASRENSKLYEGDVIKSVNGFDVTETKNFYSLLTNTADDQVLLSVENKDGNSREVVIRPASSLDEELYEAWVNSRKKLTDEYSGGKLGYIHIQGMDMPSFERFERELTASGLGKDGLVIDVRFNGGGWTTDYLMTVLNVRQHAYTIPRGAAANLEKEQKNFTEYYPYGERLPYAAWVKPSIAMCNSMSYSNAEIFSHAYKTLDIGTLVGEPTFGAVISTGGAGLIDGSFVRLPGRGWYVKATGKDMEDEGAIPDIIVRNNPGYKAENNDEQLRTAVNELLKQMDSK